MVVRLEARLADRALVERARKGDQGAYEALARSASRRLFVIAHRILRDIDASEDAVQQTLVTIWKELPRLRDDTKFDAWTYRLVTRAAITEAKRLKRSRELVEIRAGDAATPDASSQVEARDTLERAFQRLTPESRAVIVLRHHMDLPIKEIADILGIPYGTVGSRLHRAMLDLRAAVNMDDTPGPDGSASGAEDIVLAGGQQS